MRKIVGLALGCALTQAGAQTRADSMEAGVFRAVVQQHGGTTNAIMFRTIEDGELCWRGFMDASCITPAEQKEFGAAIANFRKLNPMPQTSKWSEESLRLTGATVSDTLTHNCDASHYAFSRAGFDPAYNVAVVRYTITIGMGGGLHCGSREAGTYLLRRSGDTWTIVRRTGGTVRE